MEIRHVTPASVALDHHPLNVQHDIDHAKASAKTEKRQSQYCYRLGEGNAKQGKQQQDDAAEHNGTDSASCH